MISAILPLVLSVVTTATPAPAPAVSGAEPAIRVTLNRQNFNRGDRARVTVRVHDDGYVVVLHTDANGRVRVLFPVDPGDDNFMKAGQEYEIRGRGDRDAFQVTSSGSGAVYAAVSMDPYHVDDFVRNNHWDYARLENDSSSANDPEAAMTSIVEQMADGSHLDYDVVTYTVESSYASSQHAYISPTGGYGYSCFYGSWDPWCDGYYPSPSYFSLGFDFGFGGFWGYRPYGFGYGFPRYGFGYGFPGYGFGFGFPRYGFGFGFGYPFYGGGFYRGGRGYGATGYGYTLGHGWSYNHKPIILGPGGGYTVGSHAGIGLGGSSIGYRNRGSFVSTRGNTSPLYGVSRFNTQRGPTRGSDVQVRYGRRDVVTGDQSGFRTRVGGNTRPSYDGGAMRPATRAEGAPARVERSEQPRGDSRPTRVERSEQPRGDSRPTRVERSEPRAVEGRSRAPQESRGGGGGGSAGGRRSGGGGGGGHPSGGGGGRRGGGGGGGGGHHH